MKEIIITSSALILCVMLIRHFFKGKIGSRLQYGLWILVEVRLIIPVSAQVYLSLGTIDEFRVLNLAERLEERIAGFTGRLEQPIGFAVDMDSFIGRRIAERILAEEMPDLDTADGATSVFLAGRTGFTWLDVLRGIWYGGMGIMAIWMLSVNLRFGHKLRRERREFLIPEKVRAGLNIKISGMLSKRTRVYTVEHLASPCLYGLPGREAIYLPENVTEYESRLRHVLTHEICHKRHGDGFWSVIRSILLIFYWFHPLVWAAAVLSKRDCELACDESVLLLLGEQERIDYGKTLLSIITGKGRFSDFACTATTMTGTGKSIKERIRYIAEKPKAFGPAIAAALILITAASLLIFTKSPLFSGGIWDSGTIYVMTEDKRIMLPDTIAGISGYTNAEDNEEDLIIYQVASGQEVGRFCTVTYEEEAGLLEAGREVVPLGNYERKPFLPGGQSGWGNGTEPERFAEITENAVPGTDSNDDSTTYIIEDEMAGSDQIAREESVEYLPDEQITQVQIPYRPYTDKCYIYVAADYSEVSDKYLEEMEYINGELKKAAGQVIITGINREITEETFEVLAEYKTQYLGDNARVGSLVNALPEPEGVSYRNIELTTGTDEKSLQINFYLGSETLEDPDQDVLFFDAVMLFATIGNLDECIFAIEDERDASVEKIVYRRTELTEKMQVENLWRDLEGTELQSWLEELHHRAVIALFDNKG